MDTCLRLHLLLISISVAGGCLSGGRTSVRGRSGRIANAEPLVYGQYIPNRSELSVAASGPAEGKIGRDSPEFSKLAENYNMDVVFKDEEGTGADRIMSQRCKDKLDSLSIMVMNQWPGVKLRVIEAWDEEETHAFDSLHYEGRAVDITTSDRDKKKLSLLARLAYDAGFDYVSYESKHHIHCSCKSDSDHFASSSGCFAMGSAVTMANGATKEIQELQLNDQVQTITSTGEIIIDTVYMFLDRDETGPSHFVRLDYEGGFLELTLKHLVYTSNSSATIFSQSQATFAEYVGVGHSIYVRLNNTIEARRVRKTSLKFQNGYFAPVTRSGNIIVNGVVSSCYALIDHKLAHLALWPMRLFSYISSDIADAASANTSDTHLIYTYHGGIHWYAKTLMSLFHFLI